MRIAIISQYFITCSNKIGTVRIQIPIVSDCAIFFIWPLLLFYFKSTALRVYLCFEKSFAGQRLFTNPTFFKLFQIFISSTSRSWYEISKTFLKSFRFTVHILVQRSYMDLMKKGEFQLASCDAVSMVLFRWYIVYSSTIIK